MAQHPVLVYMKGTPSRPQCGFSQMVCRVLDGYGESAALHAARSQRRDAPADVPYASRNVLEDPDLREGIKAFTAWPTIPQVFISGEFVVRCARPVAIRVAHLVSLPQGGCDILMSMHKDGSLRKQLDTAKSS